MTKRELATLNNFAENARLALTHLDDFQEESKDDTAKLDAYIECVSELRLVVSSLEDFLKAKE